MTWCVFCQRGEIRKILLIISKSHFIVQKTICPFEQKTICPFEPGKGQEVAKKLCSHSPLVVKAFRASQPPLLTRRREGSKQSDAN